MVAIHRVWQTKNYKYDIKVNATILKYQMLNTKSSARNHLESYSGLNAMVELFGAALHYQIDSANVH